MNKYISFNLFWKHFRNKPISDRQKYFCSLTRREQSQLIYSFFKNGWHKLCAQNIMDQHIEVWKIKYGIDIINLRIQAIKYNKIHLIEKYIWDEIEKTIYEMKKFYNTDILLGGLIATAWGKDNKFYKISFDRRNA